MPSDVQPRVIPRSTVKLSASQVVHSFISYYKPYKVLLVLDLVCALALACVDLAFPQLLNFFTRDFFQQGSDAILAALGQIALLFVALYGLRTLCQYFVSNWGHVMGARMEADMREDLFNQYQRLSFSYYDRNNTGEMISKLLTDLFDVSELAHHGPENLLICTMKIVGSFILLCFINIPLTLGLLVATAIMAVISAVLNYRRRTIFRENRETMANVNAQTQDSLGGIRIVKAFGNEQRERDNFRAANRTFISTKERSYKFLGQFHAMNSVFTGVLYGYIVVGGGWFVATGQLEAVSLAIYALYIGIFIAPIEQLINFVETFQKGYAGFRRVCETLAEEPDVKDDPSGLILSAETPADISFDDVSFSYDGTTTVLDRLNLSVAAGSTIALVGPSGGGKSTTCALIPRFYDVTDGQITIAGKDVRSYTLESLRQRIGFVQQDVYLFDGTIRDNIAYGNLDASENQIIEAAKRANIHDFVMSLPDGYDTYVGERGTRLSGGQKQRVSIARIFLRDPSILILDEATSALDNESERAIQASLDDLSQGRTTIVIAHRLSTIHNAQTIAVVDEGRVVEVGTHEQLMELDGTYARYYHLQFGSGKQSSSSADVQ